MLLSGCSGTFEEPLQEDSAANTITSVEMSTSDEAKEKQEITMAFSDYKLQEIAEAFNEQSENYYITFLKQKEDESYLEYKAFIENELEAGRGPDILARGDILLYVKNGYIQPLDGILQENLYVESIMQAGKIDGVTYGVPYSFSPRLLMISENLADGRTFWNLQEMINTIKDSNVKTFLEGYDGADILYYCVFADATNKEFVDWENGMCNLTSDDFLEIMEFAREYGDFGNLQSSIPYLINSGEVAAMSENMISLGAMNYYDAIFEGQNNYIGFPCAEGKAFYAVTENLYMNASSDKKDGVAAFINYLLSEEVQNREINKLLENFGNGQYFSVRLSSLEYHIAMQKAYTMEENVLTETLDGVKYYGTAMTDTQEQQFRDILKYVVVIDAKTSGLEGIIDEATKAFFAGEQTAAEAAEELQNSVQAYLDKIN